MSYHYAIVHSGQSIHDAIQKRGHNGFDSYWKLLEEVNEVVEKETEQDWMALIGLWGNTIEEAKGVWEMWIK